jgi:DNA-binding response OmpR family regulator
MAHILAVDDEPDVLDAVKQILERADHQVSIANNGMEALEQLSRLQPDLVILDVIMPELDGIEVARRIRANPFLSKVPILFLTAKGRPTDVAHGLDAGGDDYLVKPFEVVELPARVRALLRRTAGGPLSPNEEYVEAGMLRLHRRHLEAQIEDRVVELTTIEHRLLYYLMLYTQQPITVEQLLQDVWEYPPGTGDPNVVQAAVMRLRAKLETTPDKPRYIRTVRGQGYMIGK